VKVTIPPSGAPTLNFTSPMRFTTPESKIVKAGPGTGPAVELSSLVSVRYVGTNATDQGPIGENWTAGPSTFYVNSVVKGFTDGLLGKHAGDEVLITVPAKDAFGDTGNIQSTVRPGDSVIYVVDITNVAPVETVPDTVPTLVYDAAGNPSKFTATDAVTKDPKELGVYPVIKGDGPAVKVGDTVSVAYFGQLYPDKDVFNAWTGQPFPAKLGASQVIEGWDKGLLGQTVGSRLILVVPPDLAYKDKKQPGIPANSTLIFAIQILAVN